ncbi:MAG: hypothetical protein IMZ53_07755 [Thermoplasmata archaeon]|nr:hypothetical protein [Thermoplasmata archaeon]MBE3140460.1 hypothetical protein [Thermoplasmata archaeon]
MRQQNPLKSYTVGIFTLILLTSFFLSCSNTVFGEEVSEINLIPSSNQILVGQEFTLTLSINPTEAIGGWSLSLRFNQALIQATNITPGIDWTAFFNQGEINNLNGTIAEIQTWSTGPYPTTTHTLCSIRFQAIYAGICHLSIEQVQVTNTSFQTIPVSSKNTTVTIVETSGGNDSQGSNEEPDGYLTDTDQDGIYDTFHNNETENDTTIQKHNNRYLIDSDGDGIWDYLFDPQTKEMTQYHPTSEAEQQDSTPLFILGSILGVILIFFVIFLLLTRKKKNKSAPLPQSFESEKLVMEKATPKKSSTKNPRKPVK